MLVCAHRHHTHARVRCDLHRANPADADRGPRARIGLNPFAGPNLTDAADMPCANSRRTIEPYDFPPHHAVLHQAPGDEGAYSHDRGCDEGQTPRANRRRRLRSVVSKRRLDRRPNLLGRLDRWKMLHDRHAESDVLVVGLATRASIHVELGLARVPRRELAVDVRSKPIRHMPRQHHHPLVLTKLCSRSASILCPRLSLDATVPMEQFSAFAISS